MANSVKIIIDAVDKASAELKKVNAELNNMEGAGKRAGLSMQSLTSAGFAIAGVATAVIGAGAAIKGLADGFMNYALQVAAVTRELGGTSEEASKLIQVADDIGLSWDTMQTAMRAAIRKGLEPTIAGIGELSDAYLELAPGIERTAFLLENFGRSGADIAEFMELGSAAIVNMGKTIEGTSLEIHEEDIASAKAYRDAIDQANDAWTTLKTTVGGWVAPLLTVTIDAEATERARELAIALGGITEAEAERIAMFSLFPYGDYIEAINKGKAALLDELGVKKAYISATQEAASATDVLAAKLTAMGLAGQSLRQVLGALQGLTFPDLSAGMYKSITSTVNFSDVINLFGGDVGKASEYYTLFLKSIGETGAATGKAATEIEKLAASAGISADAAGVAIGVMNDMLSESGREAAAAAISMMSLDEIMRVYGLDTLPQAAEFQQRVIDGLIGTKEAAISAAEAWQNYISGLDVNIGGKIASDFAAIDFEQAGGAMVQAIYASLTAAMVGQDAAGMEAGQALGAQIMAGFYAVKVDAKQMPLWTATRELKDALAGVPAEVRQAAVDSLGALAAGDISLDEFLAQIDKQITDYKPPAITMPAIAPPAMPAGGIIGAAPGGMGMTAQQAGNMWAAYMPPPELSGQVDTIATSAQNAVTPLQNAATSAGNLATSTDLAAKAMVVLKDAVIKADEKAGTLLQSFKAVLLTIGEIITAIDGISFESAVTSAGGLTTALQGAVDTLALIVDKTVTLTFRENHYINYIYSESWSGSGTPFSARQSPNQSWQPDIRPVQIVPSPGASETGGDYYEQNFNIAIYESNDASATANAVVSEINRRMKSSSESGAGYAGSL